MLDMREPPYWILGCFALPLSIVAMKALRISHAAGKTLIAAVSFASIPMLVIYSGWTVAISAYKMTKMADPSPEDSSVAGNSIRCVAAGGRVEVSGYLITTRRFAPLAPNDFQVSYTPDSRFDLGRPKDTARSIALVANKYTKFAFSSQPLLKPGQQLPSAPFDCTLAFAGNPRWSNDEWIPISPPTVPPETPQQ
jgi:hypothetical protein